LKIYGNSFAVAWEFASFAGKLQDSDDMVKNLGQGYIQSSKVRAVENALVKIAHRENELRKAQLLQAPPSGQVWKGEYRKFPPALFLLKITLTNLKIHLILP
jgi:hypothetical protein